MKPFNGFSNKKGSISIDEKVIGLRLGSPFGERSKGYDKD